MKSITNKAGIILFFLGVITMNVVIHFVSKSRTQSFHDSLNRINGILIGHIVEKDSLQQNVGLIRIQLITNTIGDFDFEELPFCYLTIKDKRAELITRWMHSFQDGDSVILNANENFLINMRGGNEILKISLDSLFVYSRTPVYFDAWRKKIL